ncbi:pachytene checkpoint protein 2 homolog [Nilaparvata lugens]|uniref:pachytene checkpoint protein 2 homolog n=1 Tax=Nilaparvata lugens TaxID=108931 RepID=UPI00193E400B|nr:pachytene checkpoint protein 2 homolog [Nilaparvata lugens]
MDIIIHVDILRKKPLQKCKIMAKDLIDIVKVELIQLKKVVPGSKITEFTDERLKDQVQSICLSEVESSREKLLDAEASTQDTKPSELSTDQLLFQCHVYDLDASGPSVGTITTSGEGGSSEERPAFNHWILPSADFDSLWDNLIYDCNIKEKLLNYAETTMFFSEHKLDPNIITWNRLVLLHGPPGTGKTSLCKAIAQKLTIRLNYKFRHGELIEINSHSLFSKFFSESGQLVMHMFDKIKEHLEDSKALIFVLIDEVESLTMSRQNVCGNEPSDAIRVVNAILTQIDQLKRYPNVLLLTTSNITGAMDCAFMDRADIKQYIGPPSKYGIYSIYKTCIDELFRAGMILSSDMHKLLPISVIRSHVFNGEGDDCTKRLLEISQDSVGLSGRALRKIPFLAYAHYIRSRVVELKDFLDGLEIAVELYRKEDSHQTNS